MTENTETNGLDSIFAWFEKKVKVQWQKARKFSYMLDMDDLKEKNLWRDTGIY